MTYIGNCDEECITNCKYVCGGKNGDLWCFQSCHVIYDERCFICRDCEFAYKCKRECADELKDDRQ